MIERHGALICWKFSQKMGRSQHDLARTSSPIQVTITAGFLFFGVKLFRSKDEMVYA